MKQAARWTAIIALFAIPFVPLYVSSSLFFPFITGKAFAFRILVEIALAAYVLLACLDARYRPRFSWTLALFGGLVAWMAIANALGVHPMKAFWSNFERMDGWVTLIHVFAFFLVSSAVLTVEKLWRKWWLFFVGVAAIVCGYGLIQLTGGAEVHQGGFRLTASLGNAIYLAAYLMFAFLIAAWLFIRAEGLTRYALLGFLPLSALILFFTGSRGPLIGLAAGIGFAAVLWLFLSRREWKDGGASFGLKLAAGSLAALVVLAGTLFLARDTSLVTESPFLSRAASVFNLDDELRVRATIWGIALEGAKQDPLTGYGQEGFNQVFNEHYQPSLYAQEPWFDRAHNMYLDWLVAGGIPALVLFLALLVTAVFSLLRAKHWSRAERVLIVSALAAYAVQALVVFDNLFSYVPLAALIAMAHASSARPIVRAGVLPVLRSETGVGLASALAVALALGLIVTVNVPHIRAANHLVYALSPSPRGAEENLKLFEAALADGSFATQEIREQLVAFAARVAGEEKIPDELKVRVATFAMEEMGKEVTLAPDDARLRVQYASALMAAGDGEGSVTQLDAAIALSPKKQSLHLTRGFRLHELGRPDEAREAFRYAYDLDTSFDEVAIAAAAGYIVSGEAAEGKSLLVEAVGTTTPDSDPLFAAYYQAKAWDDLIAVARARVAATDGSAASRYRLAQALAAGGRFSEARAEVTATIAAFPGTRSEGEALMSRMSAPAR